MRLLVGIGIGLVFPVAYTLASEIAPIYNRSNYINNISFAFPLGEMGVCILCYFFLTDCENWRKIVFVIAIPAFISFILLFYIDESPRFLLNTGRYEEAFAILDAMGTEKNTHLSNSEKSLIKNETEYENINCTVEVSYKYLVSKEYLYISLKIWIIWICSSFIFWGFLFIFPQILAKINLNSPETEKKNIYVELIIASSFMIPVTIIGGMLSENKYLGRRYSMAVCFAFCGLMCIFCIMFQGSIMIWGGLLKFGTSCQFCILITYTSEVYHTKIRTIGSAAANIITRIGGIISPFALELMLKYYGENGPLFVLFLVSIFSCYLCTTLKVETYQKPLDQVYKVGSF